MEDILLEKILEDSSRLTGVRKEHIAKDELKEVIDFHKDFHPLMKLAIDLKNISCDLSKSKLECYINTIPPIIIKTTKFGIYSIKFTTIDDIPEWDQFKFEHHQGIWINKKGFPSFVFEKDYEWFVPSDQLNDELYKIYKRFQEEQETPDLATDIVLEYLEEEIKNP